MQETVVLIFLGDFFFDARCINMANTLIDAGMKLNIIDAGENNNQYRDSNIYHINLPDNGVIKYVKFYFQIKKFS